MFFGELGAHLAQEGQFAFVVVEQLVPHRALPLPVAFDNVGLAGQVEHRVEGDAFGRRVHLKHPVDAEAQLLRAGFDWLHEDFRVAKPAELERGDRRDRASTSPGSGQREELEAEVGQVR
jgi:hypothetical protein